MNTRLSPADRQMRKAPGQRRSQVTVAAIVQAAAQVLADKGWAKFTTNEVARVAGVSIGSLYQYFPNKLALAEAIRRQHLAAILQVFQQSEQAAAKAPLPERVAQLVDGIIAAHRVNPRLHHVLLDEVPLSARGEHQDFEQQYAAFYAALVSPPAVGERPLSSVAGRVLASAVEGVVHDAARRDELGCSALRGELCRLVCAFISG